MRGPQPAGGGELDSVSLGLPTPAPRYPTFDGIYKGKRWFIGTVRQRCSRGGSGCTPPVECTASTEMVRKMFGFRASHGSDFEVCSSAGLHAVSRFLGVRERLRSKRERPRGIKIAGNRSSSMEKWRC